MSAFRRVFLSLALAGGVAAGGCGDRDADRVIESEEEVSRDLKGTWTATGEYGDLGEVEVWLTLEEDGSLSVVVVLDDGGRLSFPGTWELQDDLLVLRGVYFQPSGEARVRYSIRDDGTLVLEDEAGATEEWKQKEPAG